MYGNLIVGVDGRAGGSDAAALAATLASPRTLMTLVYVSTAPTANRASALDLELADEAALPALLETELAQCGSDAQIARVVSTSIGAGLEDAAERRGAELIVVGASRRHGLARLVSGDDVRAVVHDTPCAVAVAPSGYADRVSPPRRIGVAFDGSPESEVALAHAGLLADVHDAELVLRAVVEPHYYAGGWGVVAVPYDDPEFQLAAARERLGRPDGLEIDVVYGALGKLLLDFSRHVDLLVCGSRRLGAVRRIALGSTSDYLARRCATPLLIAPASDTPSVERWRAQQRGAVA